CEQDTVVRVQLLPYVIVQLKAYWTLMIFFSSRRRHTRWLRDWSSDVCSSDLVFSDLDLTTSWDAIIAAEPALQPALTDDEFCVALDAIADFTDVKSPYTLGHSRGVAELAEAGARHMGMAADEVELVRRAALVHDMGKLGVSNSIWDKQGGLTSTEHERVRIHPY